MTNHALNGAQVILDCLKREGVDTIFGYPGGSAIPLFDALLDSNIKMVLSRHEQGATHMADGYARATGKVGVVLVTSGPGATNTFTGIYTALMDSSPIVVLAAQTTTPNLGKDAFQECDTSGMTFAAVKHSFLVKNPNDLPRIVKEAFHIARSGRPGPVLIDLPKDVTAGNCTASFSDEIDLPGYKIPTYADPSAVEKAAALLKKSTKPLLLVGHGAIISNASRQVKELAEKLNAPVVETLLGLGAFPETHPLSLGMLGMHGTAYANKAVLDCDLIMSIGSRWDDRIVGKIEEFCKGATIIHIDIDPAEEGKILQPDAFLCGDAKLVLEQLLPLVSRLDTDDWVKTCQTYKKRFPLTYPKQGGLRMQHIISTVYELTKGKAIVTTDVGQHQMWVAQFFKADYPRQFISSGGAGTMGFGFPSAIGAAIGVSSELNWPICCFAGDGGFQMTEFELSTAAIHKLPIKIFVMDNKYLGMVRQWQDMFYGKRYSSVSMEGNPDFVKLAEAYGIKAFRIKRSADAERVIQKALEYNEGPVLIHCECEEEDNVFPMIPAGAPLTAMMTEPPKGQLEKPTGST
ncbi:MAG: biosynthetic-type acetolactate synthase large subunit [Hallerella sp.]|jgi:acetolactate synthase-1/2/3 large subunit|nr:biosynthetic-type acetolactate synthase large subunit [Fibrobacter sp.]MDY6370538.1 biosynthetic-type acetolactate synthase large subunit [Fibrobacter sp.]MDY6389307.1 biosynthetic-type acetolactate synthase large subunit [Fibrobacter sp.]MEE3340849.1 biosynthetic-type acetolactate synthase large subunit [Hallerella sp.]